MDKIKDWEWGQGQSSYQEISTFQDSDDEKQLQGPFMSPLFKRRGRKNTQDNGNGSHQPHGMRKYELWVMHYTNKAE